MSEAATLVSLLAPVGPVADRFIADERVITGLMGPYGSGKTTTCIGKIWQSVGKQPLVRGTRKARWAVVRDTYQQLETNVLNSWFTWFPKTKDNWNGREMRHTVRYQVAFLDGRAPEVWELEMYFRAMGDQKAEAVLKGLELTGLWLNEVDTLDKSVLRFGLPRTGRYPSAKDGGCAWSGVIADFNAPDVDNWTYELFVEQDLPLDPETVDVMKEALGPRFGVGFHRQPGGRSTNPLPENIRNLEAGYYAKMMIGLSQSDVRRFVDNEFGAVRNGQPVYPEYNDTFHCASDALRPIPGLPVCLGVDGGNTPAVVFGQRTELGQIRTLDELVVYAPDEREALQRLGPRSFGQLAGETWIERFGRAAFGAAWGDPAIWFGETADFSWAEAFEQGFNDAIAAGVKAGKCAPFKLKLKPAPGTKGNRLTPRIECVRAGLVQNVGGQPGQLISPTCKVLRRGFNNGYVINRVQLSNGMGRWKDEPLKNDFSHVHDAKQYLDLGLTHRGDALLNDRERDRGPAKRRGKVSFGSGPFSKRRAA